MNSRYIRHLTSELFSRLSDRAFLKRSGLSRRSVQSLFEREKWEQVLSELCPAKERYSCAQILEVCRPELSKLAPEPEKGWMSFT